MGPTSAPRTGASGKIPALLTMIVAAVLALTGTASAADSIYWSNAAGNTISYANLDGSGGGNLPTGLATVDEPAGQAIDAAIGRIYWVNHQAQEISYASLDGSGGHDLPVSGVAIGHPSGLAIDPVGGKLYWSDGELNEIAYASLNGAGAGVLATTGATLEGPQGVALDPEAGRIYWTNRLGNKISYARLDGSGGGDLSTAGATVNGPIGLAIDPFANRVYWANSSADSIAYASLDGSGAAGDLATGAATLASPNGIAIDRAAGRLYWANATGNTIAYANLDGSGGGDLSTAGADLAEPNLPVLLQAPAGAGQPEISGTHTIGKPLFCSQGKWAPDQLGSFLYREPVSYAYSWLRNGEPIAEATESRYRPTTPGVYDCRATATNFAGTTTQTSADLTLLRGYAYASGFAPVHGRRALVTLTCTGDGRCKGLVKLIAHIGYRRVVYREGHREVIRHRGLLQIGKGSFSINPGRTKVLHVRLKQRGVRLLRNKRRHRMRVRLLGRDVAHRALLLKAPG